MPSSRSLLVLAWLFTVATARAENAAGSYQAATWDRDITLPVDAYRAPKPIDLKGSFTVKTLAGTLVDAVSFQAREDRQHFHLEGTLFRRCRFGMKIGASGHGIDSVYEDCLFNKDDTWSVPYWATRWVFDNCIFTKQFLRSELFVGDYAAHAARCTFYGVKLPTVVFKEDPGAYVQKGDLAFEKCRFVDCDVPQSFLAATVDCIFENCRFEAKNKLVWSKETTAIKVRAYYTSGGTDLAPFVNGPLSVTFEKAPLKGEFGSSVAHTQSGGKVTLTNQRLSGQFTALGTMPRKASEIVDVPAAKTDGTGSPGLAPLVAAGEVRAVEEIFRALPSEVEVLARGVPSPAGLEAANAFLSKNYAGRAVALPLTVGSVQAVTDPAGAYQASARPKDALYHGASIPVTVSAVFAAANAAPLRSLKANVESTVRGVVRRAEFVGRGTTLAFVLVIGDARLGDAPSRTVAADPGAGIEAQLLGNWTVLTRSDGAHYDQTFAANHSITVKGQRIGAWEIKGKQLHVTFDDKTYGEYYDLPPREGAFYGQSTEGVPMTMGRADEPTPPALLALIAGRWDYLRLDSKEHLVFAFGADGAVSEGGTVKARWRTVGKTLLIDWAGHSDWHDIFPVPGSDGVLMGVNGSHMAIMLTRLDPAGDGKKAEPAGYFGAEGPQ